MHHIRNAREDEIDALTGIGLRAWAQAMGPIGGTEAMQQNALRAFADFVRSSWIKITVIEESGQPVGWAAREALDEKITDFWIEPGHQRRGLGSELLKAVEEEVEQYGFDEIRLETHAHNTDAVGFFEKNGYRVNWLSVAYAPKIDQDVQSVGMSKQLVAHPEPVYGLEF